LTDFFKNTQYKVSQKSAQWELSCSLWVERWTDGQTDTWELIATSCSNCRYMPKNCSMLLI